MPASQQLKDVPRQQDLDAAFYQVYHRTKYPKTKVQFQGLKKMTPGQFTQNEATFQQWVTKLPYGWGKDLTWEQLRKGFEQAGINVFKDTTHGWVEDGEDKSETIPSFYTTNHIWEKVKAGQMRPAIMLDVRVGDGIHRAYLYQALGEKMTVALFTSGRSTATKVAFRYMMQGMIHNGIASCRPDGKG